MPLRDVLHIYCVNAGAATDPLFFSACVFSCSGNFTTVTVWKLEDLNAAIEAGKAEAEIRVLRNGRERSFRRRPRDPEEISVLTQICLLRWKKAEAEGKIRYISKTKWYYDPS